MGGEVVRKKQSEGERRMGLWGHFGRNRIMETFWGRAIGTLWWRMGWW